MQIVRESINFTRGLDPKSSMGTGIFGNAVERLFKEDKKLEHYYCQGGTPGNIFALEISPTRFIIKFYNNKFIDPITEKKIVKIKYANQLIETIGLKDIFLWSDYNPRNYWAIFKIKPEYCYSFKKGHYMP
jgi:hypothetical protein